VFRSVRAEQSHRRRCEQIAGERIKHRDAEQKGSVGEAFGQDGRASGFGGGGHQEETACNVRRQSASAACRMMRLARA
jgi:hypothetical protein